MDKVKINDFTLLEEIILVNGNTCRIFVPPISLQGCVYYWIRYTEKIGWMRGGKFHGDITIIASEDLKATKLADILYSDLNA